MFLKKIIKIICKYVGGNVGQNCSGRKKGEVNPENVIVDSRGEGVQTVVLKQNFK